MNIKTRYIRLLSFFLLTFLFSCARETVPVASEDNDFSFPLNEAKRYYQEHIGSVVPVTFHNEQECTDPDHHHVPLDSKSYTGTNSLTPHWDKASQVTTERAVVLNIPLQELPDEAILFHHKEGTSTVMEGSLVSTLVMVKDPLTGAITCFITTLVGEGHPKDVSESRSSWLYTGNRSAFTGFLIISDESGNYLSSCVYEKGSARAILLHDARENRNYQTLEDYWGYTIPSDQIRTKSDPELCNRCGLLYLNSSGECWLCDGIVLNDCEVWGEYPGGGGPTIFCPVCWMPMDLCLCWAIGCPICGDPFCDGSHGGGGNPPTYYTVSLSANPYNYGSVTGGGSYQSGNTAFITANPFTGYAFVNWTGSATAYSKTYSFSVNSNMSFTANFKVMNPCIQATDLGWHSAFKYYMMDLTTKVNDNKEHVTLFNPYWTNPSNNASYLFGQYQGPPDQYTADIPIPFSNIGGLAHSHYGIGSLSIFSPGDLYGIYQLLISNKIENTSSFFYALTTGHGTSYMLMIDNVSTFMQFGNSWFGSATSGEVADALLSYLFSFYGISPSNSVNNNEYAFLNFLGAAGTGLTLFKGNPANFNSWNRLGISGGSVIINSCP